MGDDKGQLTDCKRVDWTITVYDGDGMDRMDGSLSPFPRTLSKQPQGLAKSRGLFVCCGCCRCCSCCCCCSVCVGDIASIVTDDGEIVDVYNYPSTGTVRWAVSWHGLEESSTHP